MDKFEDLSPDRQQDILAVAEMLDAPVETVMKAHHLIANAEVVYGRVPNDEPKTGYAMTVGASPEETLKTLCEDYKYYLNRIAECEDQELLNHTKTCLQQVEDFALDQFGQAGVDALKL